MGNKRITEKDFWICDTGNVPAQFQSTQTTTAKKSGEKYITVRDTSTSSWIDFGCKKMMLIYAIIAAAVVVIAAMTVATGGAALIALGALAGLAGAAWGAVVGALLCGQLAAKTRKWVEPPTTHLTAVQGVNQVTGDCTMTCAVGGTIHFAPQIKSWSQAISLGAANYIGGLMEGMMAGAAIGMGGAALSGGAGAFATGGIRGVGQAALQFAKSMPKNFYVNALESVGKWGLGLRGVMGAQNVAATYGNTGQAGVGDFAAGTVSMETGAYHSATNIANGNGTWQDFVGMAMMFSPVGQGKRDLENGVGNKADEVGTNKGDESTSNKADESETNKADEENAPKAEAQETKGPEPGKDGETYSDADAAEPVQDGDGAPAAPEPKAPEFEFVNKNGKRVKRLKPNQEYEVNGYKYKTDAQGRISEVEGGLKLEKGGRSPSAQRSVGKNDGRLTNDQGGHLIGDQFGGAGGRENLVPMDADVNNYHKGEWGQMEKNWAEQLKDGKNVDVKIEPKYGDDSVRPTHFEITEIIDGVPESFTIFN